MGAMGPWHWLVVLLVFVLLFGAKKLPEMARSVGQSARVLKSELKGMQSDEEARGRTAEPTALPAAPAPQPQTQPADGATSSDTPR